MLEENYLKPLLVRSPGGRTGTSLMMELLSSSDSIAFDRKHPYEVRMLSYFFKLSMVMFEQKGEGWGNDLLVRGPLKLIGPIPVKTELINDPDSFKKQHFVSSWSFFSNEFKKSSSKNEFVKYYAEKVPHDVLEEVKKILNCKIIYLVRDPRAELSSILSFNKKRGSNNFGWKEEDTIDSYCERFILQRKNYFKLLSNSEKNPNSMIVKYESMITDVDNTCNQVSNFLGVDINNSIVEKNLSSNQKHMTSGNPRLSLDKWKNDLPEEIINNINRKLNFELKNNQYIV